MKPLIKTLLAAGAVGLWLFSPCLLKGQWASQSVALNPGWNAVFLEVQPMPDDGPGVFQGLPVESVWRWNRRFESTQFISNPGDLVPTDSDWLVYVAEGHSLQDYSNLYAIEGGRPYLIKVSDDAAPFTWEVTGKVIVPRREWVLDSLNFVGFPVPSTGSVSYSAFFAGEATLADGPFYRLAETGRWVEVAPNTPMRPGEGFWVHNQEAREYSGPIKVTMPIRTGLGFGEILGEQTVEFHNRSGSPLVLSVQPVGSLPAGSPLEPSVAGPVPLAYWHSDVTQQVFEWVPFTQTLTHVLAAGQTWRLRLAVQRAAMGTPSTPPADGIAHYQSMLKVTDSLGLSRALLPVTAELSVASSQAGAQLAGLNAPVEDAWWKPGLWVGSAVLNQIGEHHSEGNGALTPAASEFSFRILLHRTADGRVNLVQQAVQMWQPGTYKPDPSNPSLTVVDQPGRFVWVSGEQLLDLFEGATLRDGTKTGRRVSTAAFGFQGTVPITRNLAGQWTGEVVLGHNDVTNPFKHLHHPDHDNLKFDFETVLPSGRESFTVTRELTLEFTAEEPEGFELAGWGDSVLGGVYRERIYGLIAGPNNDPIEVEGFFRIHRASLEQPLIAEE